MSKALPMHVLPILVTPVWTACSMLSSAIERLGRVDERSDGKKALEMSMTELPFDEVAAISSTPVLDYFSLRVNIINRRRKNGRRHHHNGRA